QLEGSPGLVELPADHGRPPSQSYRAGREKIQLPLSLANALRMLGEGQRSNLLATLLASIQTLAHRYTGSEDIVVGTPATHRTPETEKVIGNFTNNLVLRTDLSGDPTFQELLQRASETLAQAQKQPV